MVDASVLVRALGEDGIPGDVARRRLRGQSLVAPQLIEIEVVSAWRRMHARGLLTAARAERALTDLRRIPMRLVPHRRLMGRCWDLRDDLTPYDAAYVAVAELFSAPLLTADAAIARAPGIRCEVEILPGS